MINLADKQKIILKAVLAGKPQRQIAREMKISRTTVARYLKNYEESKSKLMESDDIKLKENIVSPPKYNSCSRKKVKLNYEIIERIQSFLKENEDKRATGRSKQQKKKIDILQALKDDGFDIGYTTVCTAISDIERKSREAFIRQQYNFGDAAEFDWGEVKLIIDKKLRIIQMGVFATCRGNYRYADLYYSQKMENFLHLHTEFFSHVGGVYRQTIYDNLRSAVARFVGKNEKEPTDDLLKLSIYYNFKFRFCNASQAHEKGHVEKSVEYIRRRVFSKKDSFLSLQEAKEYLRQELKELNLKGQILENGLSASSMLSEEKVYLLPLPPKYDTARVCERRVNKYSVIEIDSCFYSVPDAYVGEFVFVKAYPEKIIIYYKENEIANHKRKYGHFEWSIEIEHYRQTFLKKPGALAKSVALLQAAPDLRKIYNNYYIGREKDFIELLEIIAGKGLDKVKMAITKLESINPGAVNTEKIKMIAERDDEIVLKPLKVANTQIEAYSKDILLSYAAILNFSSQSEVKII
ncbi:MAG: IS21 family transposase [Actinomycetota bacterium]